MGVEIILLGLMSVVFFSDFLLKGVKKKNSSLEIKKHKTREVYNDNSKKSFFKYVFNRKKNISLLFLTILHFKVLIHFLIFNEYKPKKHGIIRSDQYKQTFEHHINIIFQERLDLFIYTALFIFFLAWFFNDKIKAR
tara:strand:- start:670 stop:1080 length:411 start_codon:yes stop_codon:yes gene_type:complete